MELIQAKDKLDFEGFKKIKFDKTFSINSPIMKSIDGIFNIDPSKYPEISIEINYIKKWDKVATSNSIGAAYMAIALEHIFKKYGYGYNSFFNGAKIETADYIAAIIFAKKHFMTHFKKNDVTLGELQKHVRGVKEFPLPGFPDVLAASYTHPFKNGRYKGFVGESYTHFVSFSKNGPEQIETLLPYGNSARPESKHYTDQMELFSNQQVKKMSFSSKISEIFSERTYHPQ